MAQADLLHAIGALPLVWQILPAQAEDVPASEAYWTVDVMDKLDSTGWDGTGRTVAILEGWYPDSWLNLDGALAGSCESGSLSKKCYSPGSGTGQHNRQTGGVVRSANSLVNDGIADQASVIWANYTASLDRDGAIAWATSNDASVINFSVQPSPGSPQTALDMYFDYVASHSPYPLIVAAAGNSGSGARSANNLRNGIVVGGGDDHGSTSRSGVTMYTSTSSLNWAPGSDPSYTGFEVPHVAAPAVNIDTAGDLLNETEAPSGTSFAAPQVSGMAASVQEQNTALVFEPETLIACFMVSANENIDEASGGVWPPNLGDSVDDRDGAGLVQANLFKLVVRSSSKMDGGNTASIEGHDYGSVSSSTWPVNTYYSEVYNASILPGDTLRVAALIDSVPTCGTPATDSNCSANPYPRILLHIYSGGNVVASSSNTNTNYQFASNYNGGGTTANVQIKVYMSSWSGLTSSYMAVAWSERP